ncbi:MAG: hypothetical protein JXB23_12645 [Candidatus Aminicenantes bacterium]|nr:hypothetical protein [Candidatus Aminicenantes bacterium]
MGNLILAFVTLVPFFVSTTTQNVERAFLQNNPGMLYILLPTKSYINISLPTPISFSDQVSNQQAYFLFKKIFASYSTFEFYSEKQPSGSQSVAVILKARWSFKDKKNNNQYVFNIFFNLQKIECQSNGKQEGDWEITEIKAEKI